MFAVVEKFKEDPAAQPVATCLKHTDDLIKANNEAALVVAIPVLLAEGETYQYEIVHFDSGTPCPECGRDYEF